MFSLFKFNSKINFKLKFITKSYQSCRRFQQISENKPSTSSIAAIFNKKNNSSIYLPSIFKDNIGVFELKESDDFSKLAKKAKITVNALLEEVKRSNNTDKGRKLVEIFDDISNELCRVADLAEFVRTAHPSDDFRRAAMSAFSFISEIVEQLNTDEDLYSRLRSSYLDQNSNLDECDKRVTKLLLDDFEKSGIHLDKTTRSLFVNVNNEIIEVLSKFQENCQVESTIKYDDIKDEYKKL
jgi:mitochondrial intermediate peptidase